MAKSCDITGVSYLRGNSVSHSNHKTRKRFQPNMQTKRLLNPATGRMVTLTLTTSALKTLQKWQRQGKQYDLRLLTQ